jgi:hypothetical protein
VQHDAHTAGSSAQVASKQVDGCGEADGVHERAS